MGLQTAPTAAPPQHSSPIPAVAHKTTPPTSPRTSSDSLTSSAATSSAPSSPRPTSSPNRSSDSAPSLNPKISSRITRAPPPPPGLFNLGNTCYLNSVVQVLYHVPPFRKAILAYSRRPPDPNRPPSLAFACDLVAALRAVFQKLDTAHAQAIRLHNQPTPSSHLLNGLRTPTRSQPDPSLSLADDPQAHPTSADDQDAYLRDGIDYVAPQRIIDLLRDHERCPEFDARGQQDAHEFLRFLLDKVNDCMQMIQDHDENVDAVHVAKSSSSVRCRLCNDESEQRRGAADVRDAESGAMASSSTSGDMPTSCADNEREGSNLSFSNSEPKQTDSGGQVVFSDKRQLEVSSRCSERTTCVQPLQHPHAVGDNDDVPGHGVQAPIRSRTAMGRTAGNCNSNVSPSSRALRCKDNAAPRDGEMLLASSTSEPNSAEAADGRQKSPAAKRRRRDWDLGPPHDMGPLRDESGEASMSNRSGRLNCSCQSGSESNATMHRPTKRYRKRLVADLFEGQAVTATRCYECDSQSDRRETFLDVSLPVEHGKSLDWALSTQCVEEQLVDRNKYFCDKCKTYTEAKRWWQVASLPEVFTVHLKLFAYSLRLAGPGGKVSVAMPCPVQTKLSEWCVSSCPQRDDQYKLTAVIVHEGGTANSGHYYSYIYKAGSESQWYCFDDAYVTSVSEEEVKSKLFTMMKTRRTAYVLFYSNSRDLESQMY